MSLRIRAIELVEVALPLVRPFRTSFGEEREKRALLVRVDAGDVVGWSECVAAPSPRFSEEWLEGAREVIVRYLGPSILDGGEILSADDVATRLRWVRGHRMSKAALEAAVLDALLRVTGESLGRFLGGVRDAVPCGVSVGIAPSPDALLEEVAGYVASGYRRVKLKIEPGWDVDVVRRAREAFADVPVSVDANAAYTRDDVRVFEQLDELGLSMIEQPFHHEDLLDHAWLQERLRTPVCLDESIRSTRDAAAAIDLGACRVINIKPGRVGGLLEGRRIHDLAQQRGVPVWVGGMLETGVGRAGNVALASLPNIGYPGDTSASDRYFREDVTTPFVLEPDGTMRVPTGPGTGVEPDPECLERYRRGDTVTIAP